VTDRGSCAVIVAGKKLIKSGAVHPKRHRPAMTPRLTPMVKLQCRVRRVILTNKKVAKTAKNSGMRSKEKVTDDPYAVLPQTLEDFR
jgi:hypothetical protein